MFQTYVRLLSIYYDEHLFFRQEEFYTNLTETNNCRNIYRIQILGKENIILLTYDIFQFPFIHICSDQTS